jgi:hypothetical protein
MPIDVSNYEACVRRIAARGSIGQREAENLLQLVSEESDRLKASGVENPIAQAAWSLAEDLRQAAQERQADVILNASIRASRIGEATKGGTTIKGAIDRLIASLVWSPGTEFGAKENVETLGKMLSHNWLSVMQSKLDAAGLLKVASNSQMFESIAREIEKLRGGMATIELPNAGPARRVAEIMFELQNAMRSRLNAAGAKIKDALDWTATTAHDPLLLRRGGRDQPATPIYEDAYQRWKNFVEQRLDPKTFDDVKPADGQTDEAARDLFLRRVFDNLKTGVHMRSGPAEPGNVGPAFEGTSNLARKISQGRVLFWKDASSWAQYMQQYGNSRDWYSLMTKAANANGKRAALMDKWGTNPAGNLNLVIRRIQEQFKDRDPDGVSTFQKQAASRWGVNITNLMGHLDGSSSLPANEMAAKIGNTAKAMMNMAYLGFVALTHASSLVTTVPSTARFYGVNYFSAMGRVIESQFKSLKAADRRELLAELGAYGDGVAREAQDYFSHGWNFGKDHGWMIPGMVAAAQNRFMKATLLPYLFDHTKAGFKELIANKLARSLGGQFGDLEGHLQNTLRGYGIGPNEWQLLKQAELTRASSGRVYLTPSAAGTIPADALEAHLRSMGMLSASSDAAMISRAVARLRSDLSDRLGMVYQDAADHAVVTPGARQRAMIQGKNAPGSIQGELLQAAMQFKSWPVAAFHQMAARQFYEGLSGRDKALGIGMVAGLSMLGGYLRMTARDLLNGDEPRVPRNVAEGGKIALASLAQGGGLGLVGDWLFGELNRFGAGNETSLVGGPIATTASQGYQIFNRWAQSLGTGKVYDPWPAVGRMATGMIPGANLFYLKGPLDYLVMYHLYEALRPGWWQRSNRMMEREQGRHMLGFKPGQPPPYNPF